MPYSSRRLLVPLLALFAFAPAARAQETLYRPKLQAKDIDPSLRIEWFGVYLKDDKTGKDQKIGYVRADRRREGDTIVDQQFTALKLVSFGQKVALTTVQRTTYEGAAPYRMLDAEYTQSAGPLEQKTSYIRKGDGVFESVHEVGKQKRTITLKGIDYTLEDVMAGEVWVKLNPKVGDRMVMRFFDLQDQKMDLLTNKLVSSKQSLAAGVQVRVLEVEVDSKNKQIKALSRYDDQGNNLSAQVAVFELRKETEQQARSFDYSQDLFVMGMVKVDRPVGHTPDIAELVVEVSGKDADVFEDGPRQRAVVQDGKRVLKLGKAHGKVVPATKEEIADNLVETNSYPITNPRIKALAEKVVAGADTPEAKVKKIVVHVNRFVKPSLSANAPNIHDLLDNKKGDCKSYALLVTNLARAAGVPAREVSGLLYCGDDFKAFGGHAWNEVVLNGVWVPVDASLGETEVDATHVSFGTEHQATRNLLSTLGKLSFRVLEVKSGK